MDCKFCHRENTTYSCILCRNPVGNVCAVLLDKSQEGYNEQNYHIGKCPNGACEQIKDKIKEKDVVQQSINQKGKTFGSFLIHGMFQF